MQIGHRHKIQRGSDQHIGPFKHCYIIDLRCQAYEPGNSTEYSRLLKPAKETAHAFGGSATQSGASRDGSSSARFILVGQLLT